MATLQLVDRTPYTETTYYSIMMNRLDSLQENFESIQNDDQLSVGWSEVNITPTEKAPLAGYGARDPKEYISVKDSIYIKTIVFRQGKVKTALVTAELLLIHPDVDQYVSENLPAGWRRGEVYFTASHTHSSTGGWASGIVGELFAGSYNEKQVQRIGNQIIHSIVASEENLSPGSISFGELLIDDLVRNRLTKKQGIIDPWFKILGIRKDSLQGFINFYSAHATTLNHENMDVSGDYPALLNKQLLVDSSIDFSTFAAGAVGSMAPAKLSENNENNRVLIADKLFEQHQIFRILGGAKNPESVNLQNLRLQIALPEPTFKLNNQIAIRPWIFKKAFGDYSTEISVLKLGSTILIGLPVELSGELAVPLYEFARSLNQNLIITSFNGDYGGYVVRDDWYDLNKYESRTMSWQGPYAGAYFSEVIRDLLNTLNENN